MHAIDSLPQFGVRQPWAATYILSYGAGSVAVQHVPAFWRAILHKEVGVETTVLRQTWFVVAFNEEEEPDGVVVETPDRTL